MPVSSAKTRQKHPMLSRVYSLDGNPEVCADVYDSWAHDYDSDTTEGMGYVAPTLVAKTLAELVSTDATVLDAGCGTGLVGSELAKVGFHTVDGTDLSDGMLDVAKNKGVYGRLEQADMTKTLPFAPASYDAITCVGTFTEGHVGPEGIDRLIEVSRSGAYLVLTILSDVWEEMGFDRYVEGLAGRGTAKLHELRENQSYRAKDNDTCRLVILQVL